MKKRLNKLNLFSLLMIAIFMCSCEKEEQSQKVKETHTHSLHENVAISHKPFKDVLLEQGFNESFEKAKRINTKNNKDLNIMNRSSLEDQYSFTITNPEVTILTTPDITSYTLHITPDVGLTGHKFQNLVIEVNNQNEARAVILEYANTSPYSDVSIASSGVEIKDVLYDDINKIAFTTIQLSNGCFQTTIFECNNPLATHEPGGPGCWATPLIITGGCPDQDGGGGSPTGNTGTNTLGSGIDIGGNTNSSGGSVADGFGSTGIITSTTLDPQTIIIKNFVRSLSPQQATWYNSQSPSTQNNINQSLNTLNSNGEVISASDIASLINLALGEENNEEAITLVNLTLITQQNGYFNNLFDSNYLILISPYNPNITATNLPVWQAYFNAHCAVAALKLSQEPGWGNLSDNQKLLRIYWEASKEMIHLALDLAGLVPVIGEVADLTNGVIYTIEGDGVNASLSYASTIPIAGWFTTGAKLAIKTVNVTSTIKTTLKWYKMANGAISFGRRGQLRTVLNLAVGNPLIAHHILPWTLQTHEVIQKAAKAVNPFHMNQALNGIPLSATVHSGGHQAYINLVFSKLEQFKNLYPNATPQQCYNYLISLINDIKAWILANPNTNINLMTLP